MPRSMIPVVSNRPSVTDRTFVSLVARFFARTRCGQAVCPFAALRWAQSLLLLGLLISGLGCGKQSRESTHLSGRTMGTTYSVVIDATDPTVAIDEAAIHDSVEAELKRINQLMSTYIDESEISRFNRHRSTEWFPVSAEMVSVVKTAAAVSEATDGAFDITVGPLVELWGVRKIRFSKSTSLPRRAPGHR